MKIGRSSAHEDLRISRRKLLEAAGGIGLATLLIGCGTTSAPGSSTDPNAIHIPNSGAKLPTDPVNFHIVDSGDAKAFFWKPYVKAYQQAHPNITVQYDGLPWADVNKVIPLGIQNGNAPDIFQVPQSVSGAQAVQEGWVHPLDDIIPNFAAWKAAFPAGTFVEGNTVFNGKVYSFPLFAGKTYGSTIYYNTDYLQKAGYDFQAKPPTWSEFRAAARKITQQGNGSYYGLIIGGADTSNQWGTHVDNLARVAGAVGTGGINWKTGQYNYTSDAYLAAIELLLALKADGSFFPGSMSLNAAQARAQMPQGAAGMILSGSWNIIIWKQQNPTFKFDVTSQPLPDHGTPAKLTYKPSGGYYWAYAKSPQLEIVGDILHYLGSEEGQTTFLNVSKDTEAPVIFPQANVHAQLDPRGKKAFRLYDEQVRLGPDPSVRNPDIAQVLLAQKAVTPDLGQVVQGIFTGQLKNPKAALQSLQDRSEAALERAIAVARAKGAKVSRDDWKFPNWNPEQNYTSADYAALKQS